MQRAAKRMSLKGPRTSTILPLLQDMAMLAMNRAWDATTWMETTEHPCSVMAMLAHWDPREDNISLPTHTSPRPKRNSGDALPLHVASWDIGVAGSIPIPPDIWRKHLPRDMERALKVAPNLGDTDNKALAVLAYAMHRDGLLIRCHGQPTANLCALPKPKSEEKGGAHCGPPPPQRYGGTFALRATFRLCFPPKSPQAHPLETPLELGDPNCPSSRNLQTTFPSHYTHHAQLEKP